MASILLPFFIILVCFSIARGCVERERVALLDFKISFASVSQNNRTLSTWNVSYSENCCEWDGIGCDDSGVHVVNVDLYNQDLQSHHLRPSLLELQHLTHLDLRENNFSMRIPEFMGSFRELQELDLSDAGFFGSVPPQLANLSRLETLDLGGVDFSEARDWLSIITKLPLLSDFYCESCSFPDALPTTHFNSSSSQLQSLRLVDSVMSSSTFSLLLNTTFNLSTLRISSPHFQGQPPNIFDQIGNLCNLWELDLSSNNLTDEVYGEGRSEGYIPITKAKFYQALIKWKGMDRWFDKNLELLSLIDLSYNNLSGELPVNMMSLTKLYSLDLSSNNFTGCIPNQIGKLKNLEYLNLSFNSLSGPIPTGLADITSIGMLDLSHNKLSGRIPKGNQLQTFDSSSFTANSGLCGKPLEVKCSGDPDDSTQPLQSPPEATHEGDEHGDMQWFYAGSGAGFACGFLGIIATLTWIKEWRYAFFRFATELGEWMLLFVALGASRISRKLRFK